MQPVHVEKLYADALQQTRCAGKHHPPSSNIQDGRHREGEAI
jgi:hypothetical protein